MRTLHFWVGVAGLMAFIGSGQIMAHHLPPIATLSDSARLMYRSRHIYLLESALVNLMLGLYLSPRSIPWRARTQTFASILVLAAPILLAAAFLMEPQAGFREETIWSRTGLYALLAGCLLHLVSGRRDR